MTKQQQILKILKQRSTIVGLVGVAVALLSLLGMELGRETELLIVEAVLAVVSVVAILTKEEEPWDGRVDRRTDSGGDGAGGGASDEDQEGSQDRGEAQT